jgi:hypothetical protein
MLMALQKGNQLLCCVLLWLLLEHFVLVFFF